MSDPKPGPTRRDFLIVLVCLVVVLGALFHRSFKPNEIVFANDNPLGAVNAQAQYAWKNLLGYWQDLNWLGGRQPGGILAPGYLIYAALKPVLFAKLIVPLSLLLLGLCAWFFFRQLGFGSIACVLGGLAAALNTNAVSISSWGLPSWTLSRACFYLALAALPATAGPHVWVRFALAGFAVGLGLMDGFDVGAVFSLYTAAYVLFQAWVCRGPARGKIVAGLSRVALVAICAALISAQALTVLIGTQIQGITGMQQDDKSKQVRWEEATRASLPKAEVLRVVVPGLFGYRMPELYGEPADSVNGSNYWGSLGQMPGVPRHSGEGEFAGVLVTLVAVWAGVQSLRRKNNPFTDTEQKFIWFWGGAAIISLLLAFGKYTPLYQCVYALPYFSTIRNPFKFLQPFNVSLVTLFACGLHGLSRRYLGANATAAKSAILQVKTWWKSAPAFDRKWTVGCLSAVAVSLVGWLVYASARKELIGYLKQAGFPDQQYPHLAESIARFSMGEVGTFIFFLLLCIGFLTLIFSGFFSGRKAKWAGAALGLLLVVDLSRADIPWIVYYNYQDRYATNPIIDQVREKPYQQRVTAELMPLSRAFLLPGTAGSLYYGEWLQHLFQFYRIQSLDIIQMPREPEFDQAYIKALRPGHGAAYALLRILDPRIPSQSANDDTAFRCGRLWQLTNTRYLLGIASLLDQMLNSQIDPTQQRFRIVSRFTLAPKPGVTEPTRLEQVTAVPDTNGPLALFEFTGALPRVGLFNNWEIIGDDNAALARLANAEFDAARTVVLASGPPQASLSSTTNQTAGAVQFAQYEPKLVRLAADAVAPCVLLLNDRFDPDWKVFVDGKPETLLRANYIMRAVFLATGHHLVEFRFAPSAAGFYVSLTGLLTGIALCGYLAASSRRRPIPEERPAPKPAVAASL